MNSKFRKRKEFKILVFAAFTIYVLIQTHMARIHKTKFEFIIQGSAVAVEPHLNRHIMTLKFSLMSKPVPKQTIHFRVIFYCRFKFKGAEP